MNGGCQPCEPRLRDSLQLPEFFPDTTPHKAGCERRVRTGLFSALKPHCWSTPGLMISKEY
jgi:hypothetical protein